MDTKHVGDGETTIFSHWSSIPSYRGSSLIFLTWDLLHYAAQMLNVSRNILTAQASKNKGDFWRWLLNDFFIDTNCEGTILIINQSVTSIQFGWWFLDLVFGNNFKTNHPTSKPPKKSPKPGRLPRLHCSTRECFLPSVSDGSWSYNNPNRQLSSDPGFVQEVYIFLICLIVCDHVCIPTCACPLLKFTEMVTVPKRMKKTWYCIFIYSGKIIIRQPDKFPC